MNWSIILLAASLASAICHTLLGIEPNYDSPEGALLHDMEIMDADVRYSALAGYKRRFDLTDDEFSDRLVKMATVTTNGNNAWLRGFTICAICDFGTTNALDFLENEAIHGSSSAGIKGYGIITDFDDRFFALAEKILADKRLENSGRRDSTYRVFKSLISYSQMRGQEIQLITRKRAREALLRHSLSDSYHRVLIDMILEKNDFEEVPYKNSPKRIQIARIACDDTNSSDYTRGYFKNVLEQIGAAVAKTEEDSPPEASSQETDKHTGADLAEPTSGCIVGGVDSPTSSETVDADKHITHAWNIMMVCGVLLFALTFLFVRLRQKQRVTSDPEH